MAYYAHSYLSCAAIAVHIYSSFTNTASLLKPLPPPNHPNCIRSNAELGFCLLGMKKK